jgi:hypothetical protein
MGTKALELAQCIGSVHHHLDPVSLIRQAGANSFAVAGIRLRHQDAAQTLGRGPSAGNGAYRALDHEGLEHTAARCGRPSRNQDVFLIRPHRFPPSLHAQYIYGFRMNRPPLNADPDGSPV